MSKLRCAVIGTGHLGKIHAGLIRKLQNQGGSVELSYVVDSDQARADQIANLFHIPAATSYAAILDHIDAAIIATPTTSHIDIASDLLAAGKHCFIEKPMACNMMQCRSLNSLANKNNLTLQVGHVENFNPVWKALRPLCRDVQFIDARRCGTYTGRSTDIGIVMDLMIHDLDLVADVVDADVQSVSAFGLNVLSKHEDFAEAHMAFRNGCTARLRASRIDEHMERKMSLYCKNNIIHLDFAEGTAQVSELTVANNSGHSADDLNYQDRLKVKESLYTHWMPTKQMSFDAENAIEQELLNFVSCISTGAKPIVDGYRGERAVIMAEQILASIAMAKFERQPQVESVDWVPKILQFPTALVAKQTRFAA